jgi:C1A family cysteine protease
MDRAPRRLLLATLVFAALVALSGGRPAAGAGQAAPWAAAAPYPASFDLRDYGRVTPVRYQDRHSTCWIMAATGSLESNAVRVEGAQLDFSENNLADHMASRLVYEGRAPSELAAAYYARWEGPVLEAADPYPRPGGSPAYLRAERHVQEVLFLPRRSSPRDNDAVKWAVSTYGGVDAAVAFETSHKAGFWKASTASYCGQGTELNHHVLCVGWDDAYPRSRFAAPPPGDGAFLIKNSWGADWGDAGYFWISYYDASFGKALAVFDGVEPVDDYDAVYQYDALGRSDWLGLGGQQAWFANRFRCAGSGAVSAVSFYTPVPGASYEVRVAASVVALAAAPVAASGVVPVGGYHTIRLKTPVAVADGRVFVAAVRLSTPGWMQPVALERPTRLIASRASAGQSYVSADGKTWGDLTTRPGLAQANACLKAFVDAAGAGDTSAPHLDVSGGVVRPGATAEVRWRLADPAFSSASAIVALSLRDAQGRMVAQQRIPAVAVGERGVWRLPADWPRGTYEVRGRVWDVAGNRQPRATRANVIVRGSVAAAPRRGR